MTEPTLGELLEQAARESHKGWVEPMKLDDAVFHEPVAAPEPGAIVFQAADSKIILTIHPDGTLERGEQFASGDEASMAMFDCLSRALPCFLSQLRMRAETAEHAFQLLHDKSAEEDGNEALRIAQALHQLPSSY